MKKASFILFLLFLDQLTKILTLNIHKKFLFFSINSTTNTGTLFGLSQGNNLLFTLLSLALISLLIYFYKKEPPLQTGFNFILAGALGNLLDRLFRGVVLDFLDFKIWPIFNLADACIVLATVTFKNLASILSYGILLLMR